MSAVPLSDAGSSAEERQQLRAFLLDEPSRKIVEQAVSDLVIPNAVVQRGGVTDAVRELGARRSPRTLLVDVTGVDLPLSAVNELAEVCEPGVVVIAVGDRNDVGLFRDLINHGVSDYLVKPLTASLVQKSLVAVVDTTNQGRSAQKLGRLVAVTGTRGGVGATLVATNVAWSIAHRRRRRCALVDLDLQFGTAALALDLEPSSGLREALEHPSRIDGLFVDRAMSKASETLYVLGGEEALGELLSPDYAALELLLKELRNRFHYVVIDLPRQVSPCTQHILQVATNFVLVTDLSLAGMRDTLRYVSLLPTVNASCQLSICANRVGEHRRGEIGRAEFEVAVGRAVDVVLPFDGTTVAAACNVGQPVVTGRGKVAVGLNEFAERICGGPATAGRRWFGLRLRRGR